ncbi:MAG: TIGR01459 family HAD-type hydrolase [Notoacmeibacter sp.]|nr:TIGR01459 family HAD-type hydrolase [Notoacmeibacter sp.]
MKSLPPVIARLDDVSGPYSTVLCDVWGVLHNGVRAFPPACEALVRARGQGKAVVLVTNSPRPSADVIVQLRGIGVPDEAYDRIVTSGDATRGLIAEGPQRVFHLGPDRDLSIYNGLDVERVEEFEAAAVVCTGLFDDETETPEDYQEMLRRFRSRDLPFICANPDIVVERGERLIWCSGALARDYGQMGGRTLISGKPHEPIYRIAFARASEVLGHDVNVRDALAIGDGMLTDIKGAVNFGVDALYVSGGIHFRDYGMTAAEPDRDRLATFLERHAMMPVAVIPHLV